jgi:hypothetical protein
MSGKWDKCVCQQPLRSAVRTDETMFLKDLFRRTMPHESQLLATVVILVLIYLVVK